MPLTFDYTNIAGGGESLDDALWQTAPFMCMSAGIGHITPDNVQEFYSRVSLVEKVNGPYRNGHDTETDTYVGVPLTVEEAKSLVGMRCNVSNMTAAAFRKQVWDAHTRWNVRGF